ncbi:hypothetical protein [Haloprofundus sp. MHR1]|uniref:hypothetical protein n=1 Tax=Haloprofundus sp. MHR1 TaxID=2572921 RepID=UPI0010BE400F|nr:hypothetical protein [Haloprofundus sp. MHR1]QCJ45857.1 hypothetical protein FCF25_01410 [Haloprofundus sp. MHR1]
MRRRALLSSVGLLVSGCTAASTASDQNASSATEIPESTETPSEPTCESSPTTTPDTREKPADAEFELADLQVTTDTDRPSHQYILETSAFYSADAVDREASRTDEEQVVVDIEDVEDEQVKTAIETAILEGEWKSQTVPEGLPETIERVDFFTGVSKDDTYTHIGLTLHHLDPDAPPAIEFTAEIADRYVAPESPGAIDFSLRNRSPKTQEIFSGTVPPFGMLYAEATETNESFLLWREYEDEGCINRFDGGWSWCDIGILSELKSCEQLSKRYEILPSTTDSYPDDTVPQRAGTYRVEETVSYSLDSGTPNSVLSFEVEFTLERMS